MLEDFHFLEPLWLLALIPLLLLVRHAFQASGGNNPWVRIVDAPLLPLLMIGSARKANSAAVSLLAIGWTIAVLALANPTWERKPQPVYQTTAARVIVLDLSRSMDATDLKPSRLARARYKIEDVLALGGEGQTGLVVYAGDAFTVAPLTRDVNTIRELLKALDPGIMPTQGARADLGLLKARELLRQGGASNGQVLLLTDGIDGDSVAAGERAAARLRSDGYRVSVLGVGTEDDSRPVSTSADAASDAASNPMNSRLDSAPLQSVAKAGGGEYRSITGDGQALAALLRDRGPSPAAATAQTDATTQRWQEQGPLLAVLLLPLAALAFRRNLLLSLALLVGLASPPESAMAMGWSDLWWRQDQQSAKALATGDYATAAKLATDAERRGSAEYKRGNFKVAADNFGRTTSADADYNRGNALAKMGRYQDAIAAYDESLNKSPSDDARANKAAVEALLKKQQQAQQPGSKSDRDSSQQHENQSGRPSQDSASGKPQDGAPKQGSNGQTDTSSGKPGERQQSAKDNTSNSAPTGADSAQQAPTPSSAADQKKPDNQFAEAAKKLAAPHADAKADGGNDPSRVSADGASRQSPSIAGAERHRQEGAAEGAQPLDSEERMAAEQWLRRIPDDPGGLLRRKFLYQYRQRAQHAQSEDE